MDETNQFALMTDALIDLSEEEQVRHIARPSTPGLPSLKSVIADASPLPHEAIFLGLAEDGLPVLLNLFDPLPGPLLISGDQASGKTTLLQTIAQAAELLHSPSEVEYGIITPYPREWDSFRSNRNIAGIYAAQDSTTQDLLHSLVTWAHNNKGDQQSVLLLIDNLESLIKLNQQAEQNLRWLLLRGPSRRVWPVITINSSFAQYRQDWLGFFRTRIFGCTRDVNDSQLLTDNSKESLHELISGSQFTMRDGNNWLNFWIPPID
jgi:tRNA A37 threonylcarbamoyladenosine biosynthesis protein TsaE